MVNCSYCKKEYSNISNLNRHVREKHGIQTSSPAPTKNKIETRSFQFQCLEGCNVSFENSLELRSHLQSLHSVDPEEEEYIFDDIGEFNEWINELEDTFGYKYVKKSQDVKSKLKVSVFDCQCTEKSKQLKDSRKRTQNDQGTRKIEGGCTSQILLTQEQGKCLVTYYKAHYAHFKEPQQVVIPKDVCTRAAEPHQVKIPKDVRIKVVEPQPVKIPKDERIKAASHFLTGLKPTKSIVEDNDIDDDDDIESNVLKNKDFRDINKQISSLQKCMTISRTQDKWKEFKNSSDDEEACTKKQKVSKNPLVVVAKYSDDRQRRRKGIIQKIQIQISKLGELVAAEKNKQVLSHILEILTNENEFVAALKQKLY